LLTTRARRSFTLPQCDMTAQWVTVPLISVNSLPISLRVCIMLIIVTKVLRLCLAHPMVMVSAGMTVFLLLLLNSAPMGSIQMKGFLPHSYFKAR
jgi:hypothetical protein